MRALLRLLPICALTLVVQGQGRGGGQGTPTTTSQPTPTPVAASGAVSGVVIDTISQRPIPGAVVTLVGAAAGPVAPGATPVRIPSQLTDEKGRFIFTDLRPSTGYLLTASRAGYTDGAYGTRDGRTSTLSRRIALGDGQWFRDARIELSRPAAIDGTVTDEAGQPVVGVIVRLYVEVFVSGLRRAASGNATKTDDRGRYRFANLKPGRYLVAVPSVQDAVPAGLSDLELSRTTPEAVANAEIEGRESPLRRDPALLLDPSNRLIVPGVFPAPPPSAAGRPQAYPTMFYQSVRALTEAAPVDVAAGDDRHAIDFRLRPVPVYRVSGRLDGPGDAIGGLTVRLMGPGAEGLGRGSEAATALSTGDGAFTFLNVPAGTYTLIASRVVGEYSLRSGSSVSLPIAPGARFGSSSTLNVDPGGSDLMVSRQQLGGSTRSQGRLALTVADRDLTGIVVAMHAGVTMKGQLVYEGSSTNRIPMTMVTVEAANGDPTLSLMSSTPRNENAGSEFSVDGLLPGSYVVRMQVGGTVKSITWNGKDYTNTPFEVSGDIDITGVVVTLTDQLTTLSGSVRDRSGQVAPSVVIAFPVEREQWTNFGNRSARMESATATTAGAFSLRSLPAGEYFAVALEPGQAARWKDPAFLEQAARVATRVSLAWNETRSVALVIQEVR